MFEFFDQVIGFFETLWQFVLNLIESLITALAVVAQTVVTAPTLVSVVPAVIGSAVTIGVSIMVIKFIIGR